MERTDQEIVDRTENLARAFAKVDGYDIGSSVKLHATENPMGRRYWRMACIAQKQLTATDPEDAVTNLE
jgi:hypothetical protein